ncbi:MAG: outer membrane lipoprotein-sorting protein [Limnochordia bacterium]|jgi:outer membrane lipoprotein-sorting protein|nr:outer membrane lipoprotein-sorting protein [Limnochordia bacterium]MDD2628906.1 outer membrane lipoprotein-sorting protein [Limnochordia bacterium]MDD4517839.1 outer membrane lipoprotein-sorting protein [Limnochordia bacterium]
MSRNKMSVAVLVLSLFVLVWGNMGIALAMSGQEVIDRVKDEYGDFKSQVSQLNIKVYDKERLINDWQVTLFTRSIDDKQQSLLKFNSPKDVAGVGLLDLGEDLMYMYLPEFNNVRRIAGSAKNGSFMGTDFTYNDLSLINYDTSDYDAKLIKEDNEFYELELCDRDKTDSSYAKIAMTVRKDDWFPVRLVFYNLDGKKQKELVSYDVTPSGKYKYPKRLVMKDFLANHSTEILIAEPEFDLDLRDDIFTTRTLQRSKIRY